MNNIRRKRISSLIVRINMVKEELEDILNEEQDYYDNIPENLLGSERAELSEEAIGLLEEANESFDSIIDNLEDISWEERKLTQINTTDLQEDA